MHRLTFFVFLAAALPAIAVPGRIVGMDMAIGTPQLMALELHVQPLKRWQIGLGYGILSAIPALTPQITVGPQELRLGDGNTYIYRPEVAPNFISLTPFVRFFPGEDNFYFQFTYALFVSRFATTGGITQEDGTPVPGVEIKGTVDVIQGFPTASIGYQWLTRIFFLNLSIGASFFADVTTNTALDNNLPEPLKTLSQPGIEQLQNGINAAAAESSAELKRQLFLVPSLNVSFGVMF